MKAGNSLESELLTLVARPILDEPGVRRLCSVLQKISDWQSVLDTAQQHGVIPLVHDRLLAECVENLPSNVAHQLRELHQANTNHAFVLAGELVKLLQLFSQHNIEVIPFKGPMLALLAYGDVGLRQFVDVDVFIRPQDVPRARRILADSGFSVTPRMSVGQEAALLQFDCAQNFSNQQNITVDLHWKIAPRHHGIALDTEPVWRRAQSVELGGRIIRTFSQEDLLLALAIHGFTHDWNRLVWISDIAGLIERNATDWQMLFQSARRSGLRRILSVALLLAKQISEARIPTEVLGDIERDRVACRFANRFAQNILEPREFDSPIQSSLVHLRIRERFRDRVGGGLHLMLTPRNFDWMYCSLPAAVPSLYYLLRPIRLVWKQAQKLVRGRDRPALAGESFRQSR